MQSYYLRRPLASPKQSHNTIRLITDSVSRVASKSANLPFQKREGNWAEYTCPKTSGTLTRDKGKNWPFWRVSSNGPSNNGVTHFDFRSLIVSKRKLLNSLQPAKTSVSPRSSLLGTFREEERLQLSDINFILMTQINVYIMNPVVMGF